MSVPIHPDPDSAGDALPLAERILLIEDNPDDVALLRRALVRAGIGLPIELVMDGETAIRRLAEQLGDSDSGRAVLPRAILLDLKLPGVFGMEVLRWIRAQPMLDRTIVIICSGAAGGGDLADATGLGADGCVMKYPSADVWAHLLGAAARRPVSTRRAPTAGLA